ncbi:MAG: ImmA/IrrE family metallo-endopeptidase [Blastocatellales bacterium]
MNSNALAVRGNHLPADLQERVHTTRRARLLAIQDPLESPRGEMIRRKAPHGWNLDMFTMESFRRQCVEAGITVHEIPLESQLGAYIPGAGFPTIALNDALSELDKVFIGFHELGHYYLHPRTARLFTGMTKLIEVEADIFAACAMIPLPALLRYSPSRIIKRYGDSAEMVEIRRVIFDRWQI